MDVTTQLRLLPSPDVMLLVQGRPATLSAEQLIAEIEWPDTAEAQVKKAHGDDDSTVAEKANFAGSMTCELLRRAEPPAQATLATPATHRCRFSFSAASPIHAMLRRRSILRDEQYFPQQRLQDFLYWVTGRRVLPEGGLASTPEGKITLKCLHSGEGPRWTDEDDEFRWPSPVANICIVVVTLPNFSKREVLAQKLLFAIAETKGRNFRE